MITWETQPIGHSTARVVERTNYAPKEAATDQGLTVTVNIIV